MRYFSSFLFFLFLASLCVTPMAAAMAQEQPAPYNLNQLQRFPNGASVPSALFAERTELKTFQFDGHDYLDFALRIPKSYQQVNDSTDMDIPNLSVSFQREILRFVGEPLQGRRPFIRVSLQKLTYNIHAEDWIGSTLRAANFQARAFRPVNATDSFAIFTGIDRNVSSRDLNVAFAYMGRAYISKNIVVFLEVAYPVNSFSEYADIQARIAQSFKLFNPQAPDVEPKRRFSMLDTLIFHHPASWVVRNPSFQDSNHYSINLVQTQGGRAITGQIYVDVIRNNSLREETAEQALKEFRGILSGRDIQLKKLNRSFKAPDGRRFTDGMIEVYDIKEQELGGFAQELWQYFVYGESYSFFITMRTPTRLMGYDYWIHNKAAFIDIIASLQ